MRLARKLFLLTMAAVAAMAFAASAASANSDIEVLDEDSPNHCAQVFLDGDHDVTGGCPVHATSEGTANLAQHTGTTEFTFSQCTNEFDARINESGSGWIYNQILGGGEACGLHPCDEAEPEHTHVPWPVRLDETAVGVIRLRTTFCVRDAAPEIEEGDPGTLCTVDVNVTDNTEHSYTFSAVDSPCINNPVLELTGTWHTEDELGGTDAEITHL